MAKTAKKTSGSSTRSNSKSSSSRSRSNGKNTPTSRANSGRARAASGPTSRGSSRNQGAGAMGGSLMHKYFVDELKDVYSAEKQQLRGMTKMAKQVTTEELREALMNHKAETETQIERLEQIFEMLGMRAQGKKCEAMEGLLKETESVIEDTEGDTLTRDAALIISAQKAEHYEIATYGGLAQLARTMGHEEIAELLAESLEEEKNADQLLTQIAESHINMEAMQEGEEEGEEEMEEEEEQ